MSRKIDAAIAEHVFGWKKTILKDEIGGEEFDVDGYLLPNGFSHYAKNVRDYSTSIADAWLVVEKMQKERRLPFQLESVQGWIDPEFKTKLRFGIGDWQESASVPIAICLAALKALGVEVKE